MAISNKRTLQDDGKQRDGCWRKKRENRLLMETMNTACTACIATEHRTHRSVASQDQQFFIGTKGKVLTSLERPSCTQAILLHQSACIQVKQINRRFYSSSICDNSEVGCRGMTMLYDSHGQVDLHGPTDFAQTRVGKIVLCHQNMRSL